MRIEELDYDLPPGRIATHPAEPRDAARLMVVDRATGGVAHRRVRDLPGLGILRPGDVMIFNTTRVLPASFTGTRDQTGGRVRGLYVSGAAGEPRRWRVMLEARGALQPGAFITLDGSSKLELIERVIGTGEWVARLHGPAETPELLGRIGATPLPPYIRKERRAHRQEEVTAEDAERYNTVYAREAGSVAAPTAGLHFTPDLLAAIDALGVDRLSLTLHVGLGTFAPIRCDRVEDHPIHREWVHVPGTTLAALHDARQRGSRLVIVGTTTVRALESLPADWPQFAGAAEGFVTDTDLLITPGNPGSPGAPGRPGSPGGSSSPGSSETPGFAFRFTDALMTNFHLPRSTLLALVAALPGVGIERLKAWYRAAIDEGYRFYSYGDAMLIV